MKRVMIVTNSLTGGGAERSMNLICNELKRRDWPISLVPINSSPPDQVIPTCEVFPLERTWKGSLANTISAMWKFTRVVKDWNPDVIILNCDLPELFGAVLLSKRRIVVLEHSSTPWIQRGSLGKIVRRILTRRKTTWVAVSSHLTIWPTGRAPSAILQNPIVSLEHVYPHSFGGQVRRLIYIGRLSSEKRPAFALEISRQTGIALEIFGDGALRQDLEKTALRESIDVHFHGRIDNPWLEIQSGDLLIVPSAFEGDGLVVIEGMQIGIPMLLADIADFRRFGFPEKNYCESIKDFDERIESFCQKFEELSIPEEISNAILKFRSLDAVGSAWEKFLQLL